MYIKYTFLFDVAALQIGQVFGAIALPVPLPLAVIAHSLRFRTSLRLLRMRCNFLAALLEVTLVRLALLFETGGLVDHHYKKTSSTTAHIWQPSKYLLQNSMIDTRVCVAVHIR
jgi:hypothetical protein